MFLQIILFIASLAITAGALYLWATDNQSKHSGWFLFAAYLSSSLLSGAVKIQSLHMVLAIAFVALFGYVWHRFKLLKYSGWVLAFAIFAILRLIPAA